MANNDKIYQAYIGELGEESQKNTEKRISWILNELKNSKYILDVGCSQGIISLLIAEQHKNVTGIDIEKEAIEFANKLLEEKFEAVKNNIRFINKNFLDFNENIKFDSIVMTEVLEHLEKPYEFIAHAKKYLEDDGLLVITVPFGINNHPDHKQIFYLSNIVDIIEEYFQIQKIEYMGRWMGIIAKKYKVISKFNYSNEEIRRLEENFLEIDRNMTERIEKLYSNNMKASEKYKQSTEIYSILKEKYNNLQDDNEKLKREKMNILTLNKKLEEEKEELSCSIEKLVNDFDEEILFLKEIRALINKLETQNNYLKHENNEYKRKLSLITDTFIGALGIKVYKRLKKIKSKLKQGGC